MKLSEALRKIIKGYEIEGITGEGANIIINDLDAAYIDAKAQLERMEEALDKCKSDFSYWSYRTEVGYLSAITWILESAKLVGVDNIPRVKSPDLRGITMEVSENVKEYGRQILQRSKEKSA